MAESSTPEVPKNDKDPKEEIQEILDFFKFGIKEDNSYTGTIVFDLTSKPKILFSVRLAPGQPVQTWFSMPPDKKYSAYVEMSRDDFLFLYSGKMSAAQAASFILTGRIKVHWFRFHEVQAFAASFDYDTPRWVAFYRARGQIPQADELILQQWQRLPTLHPDGGALVDEDGRVVAPDASKALSKHRVLTLQAIGGAMLAGKSLSEAIELAAASVPDAATLEAAEAEAVAAAQAEVAASAATATSGEPTELPLPPGSNEPQPLHPVILPPADVSTAESVVPAEQVSEARPEPRAGTDEMLSTETAPEPMTLARVVVADVLQGSAAGLATPRTQQSAERARGAADATFENGSGMAPSASAYGFTTPDEDTEFVLLLPFLLRRDDDPATALQARLPSAMVAEETAVQFVRDESLVGGGASLHELLHSAFEREFQHVARLHALHKEIAVAASPPRGGLPSGLGSQAGAAAAARAAAENAQHEDPFSGVAWEDGDQAVLAEQVLQASIDSNAARHLLMPEQAAPDLSAFAASAVQNALTPSPHLDPHMHMAAAPSAVSAAALDTRAAPSSSLWESFTSGSAALWSRMTFRNPAAPAASRPAEATRQQESTTADSIAREAAARRENADQLAVAVRQGTDSFAAGQALSMIAISHRGTDPFGLMRRRHWFLECLQNPLQAVLPACGDGIAASAAADEAFLPPICDDAGGMQRLCRAIDSITHAFPRIVHAAVISDIALRREALARQEGTRTKSCLRAFARELTNSAVASASVQRSPASVPTLQFGAGLSLPAAARSMLQRCALGVPLHPDSATRDADALLPAAVWERIHHNRVLLTGVLLPEAPQEPLSTLSVLQQDSVSDVNQSAVPARSTDSRTTLSPTPTPAERQIGPPPGAVTTTSREATVATPSTWSFWPFSSTARSEGLPADGHQLSPFVPSELEQSLLTSAGAASAPNVSNNDATSPVDTAASPSSPSDGQLSTASAGGASPDLVHIEPATSVPSPTLVPLSDASLAEKTSGSPEPSAPGAEPAIVASGADSFTSTASDAPAPTTQFSRVTTVNHPPAVESAPPAASPLPAAPEATESPSVYLSAPQSVGSASSPHARQPEAATAPATPPEPAPAPLPPRPPRRKDSAVLDSTSSDLDEAGAVLAAETDLMRHIRSLRTRLFGLSQPFNPPSFGVPPSTDAAAVTEQRAVLATAPRWAHPLMPVPVCVELTREHFGSSSTEQSPLAAVAAATGGEESPRARDLQEALGAEGGAATRNAAEFSASGAGPAAAPQFLSRAWRALPLFSPLSVCPPVAQAVAAEGPPMSAFAAAFVRASSAAGAPTATPAAARVVASAPVAETLMTMLGFPIAGMHTRSLLTLGAVQVPSAACPKPAGSAEKPTTLDTAAAPLPAEEEPELFLLPVWHPKRLLTTDRWRRSPSDVAATDSTGTHTSQPARALPIVYTGLGSGLFLDNAKARLRLQLAEAFGGAEVPDAADAIAAAPAHRSGGGLFADRGHAFVLEMGPLSLELPKGELSGEEALSVGNEDLQAAGLPRGPMLRVVPPQVIADLADRLRRTRAVKAYQAAGGPAPSARSGSSEGAAGGEGGDEAAGRQPAGWRLSKAFSIDTLRRIRRRVVGEVALGFPTPAEGAAAATSTEAFQGTPAAGTSQPTAASSAHTEQSATERLGALPEAGSAAVAAGRPPYTSEPPHASAAHVRAAAEADAPYLAPPTDVPGFGPPTRW